jgi:hypothetical protein
MQLNVNDFVKESLKIKGSIDVKKSTANKLKELEKNGVQIGMLLAGILEDLDLDGMLKSLKSDDAETDENVSVNTHGNSGLN